MYEISLVIHIASMVISLALMSGAVGLGLIGKKSAMHAASFGMYATVIGFISGVGLMLDAPLTMKCALLTLYLVGISGLYYAGFGFGRIEKARLIRHG